MRRLASGLDNNSGDNRVAPTPRPTSEEAPHSLSHPWSTVPTVPYGHRHERLRLCPPRIRTSARLQLRIAVLATPRPDNIDGRAESALEDALTGPASSVPRFDTERSGRKGDDGGVVGFGEGGGDGEGGVVITKDGGEVDSAEVEGKEMEFACTGGGSMSRIPRNGRKGTKKREKKRTKDLRLASTVRPFPVPSSRSVRPSTRAQERENVRKQVGHQHFFRRLSRSAAFE
jgi:hypothetical protein